MQRLDRFLSEAGVASRRELRAIIRAGRVRVNDVPALAPEQKIDETSDRVTLDGEAVGPRGAGGVRRQRERDFGRVFTGLLFALFVATLLMAILAGTDVYRGLNREGDAADNQRLSLTLLANDVRANDQIDAVACAWVTEEGVDMVVAQGREELWLPEAAGASDTRCLLDGPALVLRETLPSGVYETRLYRYDGVIMEEYALADAPYDPSKATAIVRSSVFDFSYGGGLLTIVTDAGQTSVALRAAGGDA